MIFRYERRDFLLALILCLNSLSISAQISTEDSQQTAPSSPTIDLDQYRGELRKIESHLPALESEPNHAGAVLREIPGHFSVRDGSNQYDNRNAWARDAIAQLPAANGAKRREILKGIREGLARRLRDADTLGAMDRKQDAVASSSAARILSAREFHRVRKPQLWQRWLEKVLNKLALWFGTVSLGAGSMPWLGSAFLWTVIAGTCGGLGFWLYRRFRMPTDMATGRVPIPFSVSGKSWRRWLEEANRAAEREDYRQAVHLGYWAGISRLEEAGAWPADRARTPREYVALLHASNRWRAELKQLTRTFELIWYGNRPANGEDFQNTVRIVEALITR